LARKNSQRKKFASFDTNRDGRYVTIQNFEISIKTMRIIFSKAICAQVLNQSNIWRGSSPKSSFTGAGIRSVMTVLRLDRVLMESGNQSVWFPTELGSKVNLFLQMTTERIPQHTILEEIAG
jgi:hypothetical protein